MSECGPSLKGSEWPGAAKEVCYLQFGPQVPGEPPLGIPCMCDPACRVDRNEYRERDSRYDTGESARARAVCGGGAWRCAPMFLSLVCIRVVLVVGRGSANIRCDYVTF